MRPNIIIAAFLVSIAFVAVAHAAALRTVALTGQAAPGTPAGVTYESFGTYFAVGSGGVLRGPVINDAGQAAFRANLTGAGIDSTNNQGVWSEGSGSLALVARTGSSAPGAPEGVNFAFNPELELYTPVLNRAGQTAFFGALTDGTVGLWSEGSGSLALVARDGTPAPGTPEGVNLSLGTVLRNFLFPELPLLNGAGQTAFWANVTGSGVDYTNDWGVWSEGSGGLALVARGGDPAPGTPEGVNFESLIFQSGFNDAGQSAFAAYLTGSGVGPSNDFGIWSGSPGSLALVARSGAPAPGTPGGVNFRDFFLPVTINNTGRVAFEAWLTGEGVDAETNAQGLWSDASGTLQLVARQGSPAPGTPAGVNFDRFNSGSWPLLNNAGQTAFLAELAGAGVTSTNNQGIWVGDTDMLELVARTGDPAPGTASGVSFSNLVGWTLNEAGQVAFRANLTGSGVTSSNDFGIWATDQSGALHLIARLGSELEVMPGVFRTIVGLGLASNTGNGDGRQSGFNNIGQLIFRARFTDGGQGVFVSSLVAHLPGDFNNDGTVDAADYVVWRKIDGTQTDCDTWRANFGRSLFTGSGSALPSVEPLSASVPEPASILLAAGGIFALVLRSRKRARNAIRAATHISRPHGRTVMQSHTHQNHQSAASKNRFALQESTIVAIAIVVALPQLAASTARGGTIEFDASKKSPAVIQFDPNGSFEAVNGYVSGRSLREVQGAFSGGTNINTLLGADAFYSQGYTGTNAVIANIESGHIWSAHEALTHVQQIPNNSSALNEVDRHATWVGMMLGGRRGGANPGAYQEGMAPDAELYSGAIATQWNGLRYTLSANLPNSVIFDQYRRAFSTGVNAAGRRADVINSSWRGTSPTTGSDTVSIGLDGLANLNPHTLFVAAAGNEGRGPNKVGWPGAAYNNMSVAALGPNPPYDRPAVFSSGGPNDYADPVNGTKTAARQAVDIAAPGENLSSAYYGGLTGGNGMTDNPNISGTGPTGIPRGSLGGPDYYSRGGVNGTSFASPTVAGGAALLYDAAYSVFPTNDDTRDARVIKAVLMNSADKTVGWNNGQIPHPNGNGGVLTTQGLDNRVGTGRMNLAAAYDQFLSGTTDIAGTSSGNLGTVADIGWDFGQVVSGTTNDYYFDSPLDGDSTFTATLTWFRDRRIDAANTVFDDSYDDLNLELWSVVDGIPASLISESSSLCNESEHFSFALPTTGDYALRVSWFKELFDNVADANQEVYGLAWWVGAAATMVAIPEPTSVVLLTMAAMAYAASRRAFSRHPPGEELANQ